MDITRYAIEKNRVTLVLVLALACGGMMSYLGMPKAEDPGFLIRTAVVMTQFPGASPERVELLVTDKLEKAIQEMPELESITSTSKTGISLINVNVLESYTELQPIWDRLRRKVERTEPELPEGIRGPTVDDEFGDVFGTVITLRAEGYSYAEQKDLADRVRDELLLIPDAAKVEIYGAQEEQIFVEYNNSRLAELGLSTGILSSILGSRNIINPGGTIRDTFETLVIEPSGNFESVEDVASTLIPLPDGALVPLREIASIRRDYEDPPQVRTHVNGERALALAVSLRGGGNILELGPKVQETVDRLEQDLPIGVDLDVVLDQATIVDKKVSDFASNLIQAVTIVMVVMLISLGLRTGLVVASLIPTAILLALLAMPWFGVGIDQMSLAALIIALGLLVDNAIVMSESILVQMQEGKSAIDAAVGSSKELRMSLLVSSLTTAAAFLPIYLAESAVGEYTASLFKVVTITLLSSWALALTLIPLLCVTFLRVKKSEGGEESFGGGVYATYRSVLVAATKRPVLSMVVVGLAFFGSLQLFALVPVIFFPDNDRATFTATFNMPTGTPLTSTEAVISDIEQYIATELMTQEGSDEPGVLDFTSFIGDSAPMFVLGFTGSQVSPEYGVLVANTNDWTRQQELIQKLQQYCNDIPGLDATIEPIGTGPGGGTPIEVRIAGRDPARVGVIAEQVKAGVRALNGTQNVRDDWGPRSKKLLIKVNDANAQRAGVTHQDIAASLQGTFSGIEATTYREGEDQIPVMLRSRQAVSDTEFGSLNVFSQSSGRSVPADQVTDVELVFQPAKILRRDRLRTISVLADLQPGLTATEINAQLTPWLEEQSEGWNGDATWSLGGEDEDSAKANASIAAKLPIAGALIVFLLVFQFNSLRKPAIILTTVPLAFIGVAVGLLVMRSYFGFMTMLGVISLAGIVINNAIVLLDRIEIEQNDFGRSPQAAIVEACQRRMRPILLTTLTTLGGMIPLYLGGGPMFEPMAVAIMFGLVVSTLLTLLVVPVLYTLLYRVDFKGYSHAAG
ncbi:MAG: efflux RND transporter permease subunit [Acidobacteriota bacterium]